MNIYEIAMSCAFGVLVFYILKGNKTSAVVYGLLLGVAGYTGRQEGYLTDDFSIPLFIGIVVGVPVALLFLASRLNQEK